jgi:hypothetical protein
MAENQSKSTRVHAICDHANKLQSPGTGNGWQAKGIECDSKRYPDAAADGSEKHSRRMRGDDALSSTAAFNLQAIRRQIRGQFCDEKAK